MPLQSSGPIVASNLVTNIYGFDNNCFIDKLSTTSQKKFSAGYSTRLLKSNYSGPMVNVRRGSDNATQDFYGDIDGNLTTVIGANTRLGTTLVDWLNGATGYVTKMYDQSGQGRDLSQTTTSAQPTIGPISVRDTLSSAGQSASRGMYACFRVNSSYTGPTINLRRSSDNATSDFYADIQGVMYSGIGSTGTSLISWLGSSTAYVATWYDQSGNGFHATQATTTLQPVFYYQIGLIDFGVQANSYLNAGSALSGPFPTGVTNQAHTFVAKHGIYSSTLTGASIGGIFGAGTTATANRTERFGFYNNNYLDSGFAADPQAGPLAPGNVVASKFDGTSTIIYINGVANDCGTAMSTTNSGQTVPAVQQTIGRSLSNEYFNSQLYYLFIFNAALSDSDRQICSSIPIYNLDQNENGYTSGYNIYYNGTQYLELTPTSAATEYPPPGSLTADTTVVSGQPYGNGTYVCSAGATYTGVSPYQGFLNNNTAGNWCSGTGTNADYYGAGGVYSGPVTPTTVSGVSYSGDWLQIQLPTAIALKSFSLRGRQEGLQTYRAPRQFVLAGSNNGSTWTLLHREASVTDWGAGDKVFYTNVNNTSTFSYFRIIAQAVGNMYTTTNQIYQGFFEIGRFKLNPSLPLCRGLQTYTYISDVTQIYAPSNLATIMSQGTTAGSSNTWAGLRIKGNTLEFVGYNNDIPFGSSIGRNLRRKSIAMLDHSLNSYNVKFLDNSNYWQNTSTPSSLSVGYDSFCVGRDNQSAWYFYGYINEIMVFTNTMNYNDAIMYFKPNSVSKQNKDFFQTKLWAQMSYKDSLPIPANPVVMLSLDNLLTTNRISGVNTVESSILIPRWNDFTAYNSPLFHPSNGWNQTIAGKSFDRTDPPYVRLNGSNQYLDGGSKTFNINTNGGFTAIVPFYLVSTTGSYNPSIFEFGNVSGGYGNRLLLARTSNYTQIGAYISNTSGDLATVLSSTGVLNPGEWAVWTLRINNTSRLVEILKNGKSVGSTTASSALTDRTLAYTYIGKRISGALDPLIPGLYGGLAAYDRYLTDTEVGTVTNHLLWSHINRIPETIIDNNNVIRSGNSYATASLTFNTVQRCNGTNSSNYIDITDIPDIPLTISCWFCVDSDYATNYMTIMALADRNITGASPGLDIIWNTNKTILIVAGLPTQWTTASSTTLVENTWYHLAAVITTDFKVKLYINGSLSTTATGTGHLNKRSRLLAGGSCNGNGSFWGYLKDVKVHDFELTANQVNLLYNSNRYASPVSYNSTNNYLVTKYNWHTTMTLLNSTGFVAVKSGSDPNVQYQLTNGTTFIRNAVYNNTRIQDYSSFKCSFELYCTTGADFVLFYMGSTEANPIVNGVGYFGVRFQAYHVAGGNNVRGVYVDYLSPISTARSTSPAYAPVPFIESTYVPIVITYKRNEINTITVNYNGQDILKYSHPNIEEWISNVSGNYWGFAAWSGGVTMTSYIRRVELDYVPYVSNISLSKVITSYGTGNIGLTYNATRALMDGFTVKLYNGYFADNTAYCLNNKYVGIFNVTDTTSITTIMSGINDSTYFTLELFGYFLANTSGTYTFSLTSDDASYLWIGTNALIGYTATNANINNGGGHAATTVTCTVSLVAGTYYPIRSMFGQGIGAYSLALSYTIPGGSASYNWSDVIFTPLGTNANFPAESAKVIKDLTKTNNDGTYYINVNGTSTQVYCLMNDVYEGGGWMMLMKASRGSTFKYDTNYWTTQNTLNPTDVTRLDGDAKYDTFNYTTISDVMAIWPDIASKSYTNVYGKNGGCLNLDDGWCWKVNNWNLYAPILQQLSSSAQTGARGIYALYRANNNYVGPMVQIRRSSDNVTQDFYANIAGNLGTLYDGAGTTYTSWIGASTAYVRTWYDQSGNGFHATQTTTTYQPIMAADASGRYYVDSQNSSTQFLQMSTTGPIPTGSSNYSLVVRHGSINNTNNGVFLSGGRPGVTNQSNALRCAYVNGYGYNNYWWANELYFGSNSSITTGNTIAATWDGTTRRGYISANGAMTMTTISNTSGSTGINVATAQQYLFKEGAGVHLNGQIYHAYIFNVALSTLDLSVITNAQNNYQSSSASNYIQNKCTALAGFQISRDAGNSRDAMVWPGYSTNLFSYESGGSRHVFGGGGHIYGSVNSPARWGVLTNNESSDYVSNDAGSGIGMLNTGITQANISAGDWYHCCGTSNLSRSARLELYGR
jgi:hypothetical protein